MVGGELTMDNLEVTLNTSTGISEAPLQLKSNCGTLVIDDFGRQKMSTDQLLNRWIVPLEKRYDYLNLPNGKKIQVPFDQLIIFSTNLEPKDLVRRGVPAAYSVQDRGHRSDRGGVPRAVQDDVPEAGLRVRAGADRLPDRNALQGRRTAPSAAASRATCCCRCRTTASTTSAPQELTDEYFDLAVENYFAVM